MLAPSEQAFLKQLQDAKVPVKTIKINPSKTQPITPALQALLSKNQALKVLLDVKFQSINIALEVSRSENVGEGRASTLARYKIKACRRMSMCTRNDQSHKVHVLIC